MGQIYKIVVYSSHCGFETASWGNQLNFGNSF